MPYLFAVLLLLFAACSSQGSTSHQPDVAQAEPEKQRRAMPAVLPPADFAAKLASAGKNAQLVDVRTPKELETTGRIAGADNINFYDADFVQKMEQLDKSKPLFLYCAVGGRSGQAAEQMSALGFGEVYDLQGGMTSWLQQGQAVQK